MQISQKDFGKTKDGVKVSEYTLENNKMRVKILSLGAAIRAIELLSPDGRATDVALGFDDVSGYENHDAYFGATVGRFANRIKYGRFNLNGREVRLNLNNGKCHLHGGFAGFDKRVFDGNISGNTLLLTYASPDMEENFPGNLTLTVNYTLDGNSLKIKYTASSDKDTILNITNHSYFNLNGQKGDILSHKLKLYSDEFLEFDAEGMTTGRILKTKGTPLDFSSYKEVGEAALSDWPQIACVRGVDHAFVLDGENKKELLPAAALLSPDGRRMLTVLTDMPAFHVYTANYLEGKFAGKEKAAYQKNAAICFEPEYYPDSVLHKNFPSPVLRKGETYRHNIVYKFDF
jgi:aldose 1-epimerase